MEEIREHWTSRPTFIIAAIGSAVGLHVPAGVGTARQEESQEMIGHQTEEITR